MSCVHPVSKLKLRLASADAWGGCETCGWGSKIEGTVEVECDCGEYTVEVAVTDSHAQWHAIVAEASR